MLGLGKLKTSGDIPARFCNNDNITTSESVWVVRGNLEQQSQLRTSEKRTIDLSPGSLPTNSFCHFAISEKEA